MKTVNLILSFLVLLAAIAGAAFSYLLWERRTVLVNGWYDMVSAVEKASAGMDRKSGTAYAEKLNKDALDHRDPGAVAGTLGAFTRQAADIMAQRDALAAALFSAGRVLEVENLADEAAFSEVGRYADEVNSLSKAIAAFRANFDAVCKSVVRASSSMGLSVSMSELKRDPADALRSFERQAEFMRAQVDIYEKSLSEIALISGSKDVVVAGENYRRSKSVVEAVRNLRSALITARERAGMKDDGSFKEDSEMTRLREQLAAQAKEISRINVLLGLAPSDKLPPVWADGSARARAAVVGKVTKVDPEFGFALCDIGSETRVVQKIGKKDLKINPVIAAGQELVVARNWGSEDNVVFVARVRIDKVAADSSVVIPLSGGKDIAVGDVVIFPDAR